MTANTAAFALPTPAECLTLANVEHAAKLARTQTRENLETMLCGMENPNGHLDAKARIPNSIRRSIANLRAALEILKMAEQGKATADQLDGAAAYLETAHVNPENLTAAAYAVRLFRATAVILREREAAEMARRAALRAHVRNMVANRAGWLAFDIFRSGLSDADRADVYAHAFHQRERAFRDGAKLAVRNAWNRACRTLAA